MNPYDFIPIDWGRGVERRAPNQHHRFEEFSGRLEGTITTLSPFFIPEKLPHPPRGCLMNRDRTHYVIPGTSIKGMIRSLVETIGPGCWWLYSPNKHNLKLPQAFDQCRHGDQLCVACRMFGLIQSGTLFLGNVGFDDGLCPSQEAQSHSALYTIILSGPKPHHDAFYQEERSSAPAGRKFYFHHSEPPIDVGGWKSRDGTSVNAQNQYIKPIGAGSEFRFSGYFENLAEDELSLLLYALTLEPSMRHKLGYAKPAGFGSVAIKLTKLELTDFSKRYIARSESHIEYSGSALAKYLGDKTSSFVSDQSRTMQALRRIWAWPGRDDIRYPDRHWFDINSQRPIAETP